MKQVMPITSLNKILVIVTLFCFAFIGIFGLYLSMSNGGHIDVASCMMSAGSCPTTFDHINHWEGSFTAIPTSVVLILLSAILFTTIYSILVFFYLSSWKLYLIRLVNIISYLLKSLPILQPTR